MESSPYPRLFVLDFLAEDEKQILRGNAMSGEEEQRTARNSSDEAEAKCKGADDKKARQESSTDQMVSDSQLFTFCINKLCLYLCFCLCLLLLLLLSLLLSL